MQASARQLVATYGVDPVVAALAPFVTESRVQRIDQILDARLSSVAIVLENLYDPHNGAAAIRSVEAFGLTGLHVVEGTRPFHSAAAVTIGCEKWIDLHRHPDMAQCATALRERGFALYAAVANAVADSRGCEIDEVDVTTPVAVVFGNECDGLTPEAAAVCDYQVALPMYGFTQSFNLSVSVALIVQEVSKRRRNYLNRPGDLNEQERARLRAEWYVQSVKAATQILDRECVKLDTEDVA